LTRLLEFKTIGDGMVMYINPPSGIGFPMTKLIVYVTLLSETLYEEDVTRTYDGSIISGVAVIPGI
jgi:hypothetical protein